ncbi:MAG: sigma-54 dependent transcriptional regulator [Gammaproteobacteria bacterium]|nr:sigma-54 dependent transcriptional regulator [Gammaproteobacteria bacterium]NNJ50199.1 sigma-54-dependent Fis family transcriptional regulator [Gammaproteobacteria bacterium]
MTAKKVLIVDDETDICELIEITLMRMDIASQSAHNLTDARLLLETEHFDLCLTDMRLPDGNGIELVEHVQQNYSEIPIAVFTAHGNMESAVKALKTGAFDFVSKPVDIQILRNLVSAATTFPEKTEASNARKDRISITGDSPAVKNLLKNISKLARNQAPVFIHGESGSGKERVAKMIHQQGSRCDGPFVPVNCGAIPAELMESEFFGHLKGSFTGAHSDKQGLFQSADGGTLFLDEIAELPLNMQVKLLRVIQEKAVRSIGAPQESPVDVRILSASHKNLVELVADGSFREDLYYRINVIELAIPSLRERRQDIPLFVDQLLNNLAEKMEIEVPTIDDEAMSALQNYHFPGNVRELENILERAIALSDSNAISKADLHLKTAPVNEAMETESRVDPMDLAGQERQSIIQALEKTRWNKTAAAKLLGLSLRQLRYRLQKLDIE